MHDQLYKSPAKLKKHTDDLGSFFRALGFTSPVEQLALRAAPAESLLTWLTTPTGPHLMEAVVTNESHTALAILVTPEELYDSHSPRVGLGLVCKAPYIKTASFSEAFFHLKSTSEAEADKRITDPHLGSKTKSHLLNFQKQQLIPELHEHSMVSAALAEADDGHWNVTNDLIYPACLEGFRRRHESSQASQANKSAEGSGMGGGSPTCATTPPSTTSSQPLFTLTLGAHEIRGIVCDTSGPGVCSPPQDFARNGFHMGGG